MANREKEQPIAYLVVNEQREALYLEDIQAFIMALEGRANMIATGLRFKLRQRLEALYSTPPPNPFQRICK